MSKRGLPLFAFIVILCGAAVGGWAQSAPQLQVLHSLDPASIFVNTSGDQPQAARVSLSLSAGGEGQLSLDVVLVLDRSATTDLAFLQEVGESFLDALGRDDRIALVSFAEEASVDVELTGSAAALRRGLEELKNVGKTAVGDGLFAATQHLLQRGRPDALWVEVLVTDGRANAGRDPELQAQRAADNGILLFTVAMGRNPDEALLRRLAEVGEGAFFRDFNLDLIDEVRSRADQSAAARDLAIVETLSPGLVYEGSTDNPPDRVQRDPLSGTRLTWQLDSLTAGDQWHTSYSVSATQEGLFSLNQAPSEITYRDFRGQQATLALPTLRLEVKPSRPPNQLPVVDFSFSPDQPSTRDEVQFSDHSYDDGALVRWLWDFGDGTTSTLQNPTHRYAQDGQYTVTLAVTDDRQGVGRLSHKLVVSTQTVRVARTIDTFLSTDATLAGETFRVTVDIQVNQAFNGLGVDENLPEDWVVTTVDNGGARFKPDELQWVFLEALPAGETRTISYEVTVPENAEPGVYTLNGTLTSASPRFESQIGGDNQVEVKSSLPVEVVVSRWDTQSDALNLKLSDAISFEQVQLAVAWWLDGKIVSDSGGKAIDFFTIQEIIAYWLTGTPVSDPLPDEAQTP